MVMKNKSLFTLISLLGVWLSINLFLFAYTFHTLRLAAISLQNQQLDVAQGQLIAAKTTLTALDWTSLGILPATNLLPYRFANATAHSLFQIQELTSVAKDLATASFTGSIPDQDLLLQTEGVFSSLSDQLNVIKQDLRTPELRFIARVVGKQETLEKSTAYLVSLTHKLKYISSLIPQLPSLLGYDHPRQYIILLQNNFELRPTGGFMGSYSLVKFDHGRIVNFEIQDIYVPDGQIPGYVKEPEPIRLYIHDNQTPGWRLRDSNWNPDFPAAAQTIDWFFEKGGITNIDGYVAVNLLPMLDMLKVVGPIYLPNYDTQVDADNFYQLAQSYAETDFFPGSTQKRDFLLDVGRQLLLNLTSQSENHYDQLLLLCFKYLNTKQIQIYSKNSQVQPLIESLRWAGKLRSVSCRAEPETCLADYLHINEANVGINKSNCCIDRKFSLSLTPRENELEHQLTLEFTNNNSVEDNKEASIWGGKYEVYLRVYMPMHTKLTEVSIDHQPFNPKSISNLSYQDKRMIALYFIVKPLQTSTIELKYSQPYSPEFKTYQLTWQKQSGITSIPISIHPPFSFHLLSLNQEPIHSLPLQLTTDNDLIFTIQP